MLTGLHHDQVRGVVLDAATLAGISSAALSALVKHSEALHLQLCRVPPAIERVINTIGLNKVLRLHPDLPSALDAVVAASSEPILTTSRKRE